MEMMLRLDSENYPNGIGLDSLIGKEKLSQDELKQLVWQERKGNRRSAGGIHRKEGSWREDRDR